MVQNHGDHRIEFYALLNHKTEFYQVLNSIHDDMTESEWSFVTKPKQTFLEINRDPQTETLRPQKTILFIHLTQECHQSIVSNPKERCFSAKHSAK